MMGFLFILFCVYASELNKAVIRARAKRFKGPPPSPAGFLFGSILCGLVAGMAGGAVGGLLGGSVAAILAGMFGGIVGQAILEKSRQVQRKMSALPLNETLEALGRRLSTRRTSTDDSALVTVPDQSAGDKILSV